MGAFNAILTSPIGNLGVVTANQHLLAIDFLNAKHRLRSPIDLFTKDVVKQLQAYFRNGKFHFNIPLHTDASVFQKKVWAQLLAIEAGCTHTYGQIAKRLKTAAQAVGNACRANPIPIVIPCHRVVAANSLGGYCGCTGGASLSRKQWLLAHEE